MNDKHELYRAYQFIGNGRPYVMIHSLRWRMKLEGFGRKEFDSILKSLSKSGNIELTGGDPSKMTDEQIKDSYTDALGYQLFSVCWRKL